MTRTIAAATLVTFSSFFALACSKTPEQPIAPAASAEPLPSPASSVAVAPPPQPAASAGPRPLADLAWDVPAAWQTVPSASSMRKATYRVPKVAGDDADGEMSVTQVGGGVDANITRWSGQFEGSPAPKREERVVGPVKVTIVEIAGTFQGGGMPGGAPPNATGPKTGQLLLAAIAEGTDPPYFFKLVGPTKTVRAARPAFDKLVASFRPR